jgi:hypothetical protein
MSRPQVAHLEIVLVRLDDMASFNIKIINMMLVKDIAFLAPQDGREPWGVCEAEYPPPRELR